MLVAQVLAPVYVVMGLSILLYVKVWQKVLDKYQKDHLAMLPLMLMQLVLGLIVVQMYNVWEWNIWLIVTVSGWGMLVKGALYMLLPGTVLKDLMSCKKHIGLMYLGGLVALVAGLGLGYYTFMV